MTTALAHDRALAIRALMPRRAADHAPAALYASLTPSGRAEVDRIVALIASVRAEVHD